MTRRALFLLPALAQSQPQNDPISAFVDNFNGWIDALDRKLVEAKTMWVIDAREVEAYRKMIKSMDQLKKLFNKYYGV